MSNNYKKADAFLNLSLVLQDENGEEVQVRLPKGVALSKDTHIGNFIIGNKDATFTLRGVVHEVTEESALDKLSVV